MGAAAGPDIVTDGLVLCLDAANDQSYPGTGTTWTDLSGNGYDGTLLNGVGYSSDNQGALSFDGSNDYVNLGTWFNYTNFSINLWIEPDNSQAQYANIIDNNHTGTRGWVIQQDISNLNVYYFWCRYPNGIQFSLDSNVWCNICITHNSVENEFSVWKNNVLVGTTSSSLAYDGTEYLRLGKWGGGSRYWNGNYGSCSIYNRALTAEEIKQNYAATRGRYGV